MTTRPFNLSANIEDTMAHDAQYYVTPNAQKVVESIVNGWQAGIHSYTIIGTYGTGKSSFLLALERDLKSKEATGTLLPHSEVLSAKGRFEVLKIVGDYKELPVLINQQLSVDGTAENVLDALRAYYQRVNARGKMLVIFIDEFGKVLEHAANNNPERELYFMQKLAEFVNQPSRKILLLTTLHQNFSAYSRKLTEAQKHEWTKVKGRFQEVVFVEPVEQLLFLAASQMQGDHKRATSLGNLFGLARKTGYISTSFSEDTAQSLSPLEPFAAYAITQAIQRYGQNERSLFSFLNAKGANAVSNHQGLYHLSDCFDYIIYNFYSYLKDANTDSMQWSSMQVAIERVEGLAWNDKDQLTGAIKLVKAIGLLNLFGNAAFRMTRQQTAAYATEAMGVGDALVLLNQLEKNKIIRFAIYKHRYILFEGTDVDIEDEVLRAGLVVSKPVNYVDDIREYCFKRIAPVKACYFQKGTPRYFEYVVLGEAVDQTPTGDTDGYIELLFPQSPTAREQAQQLSRETGNAIIFVCFDNTEELVEHLHQIAKYRYILDKVLIDKSDRVAISEVCNLMEYEKVLLNKAINEVLFDYSDNVTWLYKGERKAVRSLMDFNHLLSEVCDDVYHKTPTMNNELFNKHKLSSSIASAKGKYLAALVNDSNKDDFGFAFDKFPPEKTIYYSLLKSTGLHVDGAFTDSPSNKGIMPLWEACEAFLRSATSKPRKLSALLKLLSEKPYKLKQGFLDFWLPTYLYIRRQDYSLYGSNGAYIPNVNLEFFDLLQKHPGDYLVKAFDVTGVRMEIFNQYRKFLNVESLNAIKSNDFIETIKPFFFFYNKRLNDYAKHTRKFNHVQTARFRDVLARAKDPEKTFFEDLPEALGYDKETMRQPQKVEEFCYVINRSVKELRSCYNDLLDRIEAHLVESLGLEAYDYTEYVRKLQDRLAGVKTYLLTDRLKEFYTHAMTEFEHRTEWYQSVCYTVLEQPLERLRDEQEEAMLDGLVALFRECEKYGDISKVANDSKDEVYALDLVSTTGTNVRSQTFRLPESEKGQAQKLEAALEKALTTVGNDNLQICTLLKLLNKKLSR